MTPEQFQRWLAHAAAGETTSYHVGFLARDAQRATPEGIFRVGLVAAEVYRACAQGLVLLVQRRLGPRGEGRFYRAVRTTKRFPPPARKPPRHRVQHLEAA